MSEQNLPSCDLVLKGGITSGVAYPPVVLELKNAYKFRNIGGTSAGAIAAAGTAAAEYNRENGGFEKLEDVRKYLGKDSNLLDLFQSTKKTQPILDILIELLRNQQDIVDKKLGIRRNINNVHQDYRIPLFLHFIRIFVPNIPTMALQIVGNITYKWNQNWQAFRRASSVGWMIGLCVGLVLAWLFSLSLLGLVALFSSVDTRNDVSFLLITLFISGLLFGSVGSWFGLWISRTMTASIAMINLLKTDLRANFYGVCNGHTPVDDERNNNTNLTDWLSSIIDNVAGISANYPKRPLTYGDLQAKNIDLQMVSANLSHSKPYVVPNDLAGFLFKESEMRQLFPSYVVDQLKTPPTKPLLPLTMLPDDYFFLPDPEQLPVVFSARLSLSFPVLISAIPLYTVDSAVYRQYLNGEFQRKLDPATHLQCNWFSDGGICSNFPIQFFDAWLPDAPTFGINLTGHVTAASALQALTKEQLSARRTARENQGDVYLPDAEDRPETEWIDLGEITRFLYAIFDTAQNYRDTLQAQLPSYRERIIQIRLTPEEGGLHLTMSPETINKIVEKGQEAGEKLSKFEFDQHWWVRFLVLMARLEENLDGLHGMFETKSFLQFMEPAKFEERLEDEWRSAGIPGQKYPYYRDRAWCLEALKRVKALQVLIDAWHRADERLGYDGFFQKDAPQPEAVLRMTTEI